MATDELPPPDPDRRFGGIERLYGQGAGARLAAARVCVIGIGGVGSWAAEALARSGVGHLALVDPDIVAESNVNRQAHALSATLGLPKVHVMRERIAGIHPGCVVTVIEERVGITNAAAVLGAGHDWVLDCGDSFHAKAAVIAHCTAAGMGVVTVGGAGGRRDPLRVRTGDIARARQDKLLARTRKYLRFRYGYPRDPAADFGVACVWSDEVPRYPAPEGGLTRLRPRGAGGAALACAGGVGSAMTVTATLGLAATSVVLGALAGAST